MPMKHITHTLRLGRMTALATALAAAIGVMPLACADEPVRSFAEMVKQVPLVPAGAHDSEMLAKTTVAIDFIRKMDLPRAQHSINEALQLDARNSYLHFLNGFVYHLQAKQGDTQKTEIAIEGYQQALRIDPSNWIAQEFLGLAYMDLKQFDRAKAQFSQVLLMTPDSTVSLQGLMVASYLTGDARTACVMADQFRKAAAQPHQGFVRSSIPVYASCGNFEQADRMRTMLTNAGGDGADAERVDKRLNQWKSFYQQQGNRLVKASLKSEADPADMRPERLAQAFSLPKLGGRPATISTPDPVEAAPEAPSAPVAPATPRADAGRDGPRMVLIDVVLLSTQELASTSKGVNLLSALTLQLGAGTGPAYSYVTNASNSNGGPYTTSTAITRAVTIPALSYSLNIANANSSVNEVLARPTLAAMEGLPSEFFSGTNLSAGVVSTSTQGGTTIVPLDKRFGIKLAVTPMFLPQGQVQLKVEAQRTSLSATADNPKVAYQIEIAETNANANVVMNLGDTLVLSGLSEKTSTSTRDGVPGLQDVPLVQYLFSNNKTNEIQRSVLILVTPRAPVQVAEADRSVDATAHGMKALREKFGLSASIPSNVEAIMNQLKPGDFFREFRQGDVSMERWDRMRTTGDRLREALGFLYY
jgi:pilus assembly protein CpaC